MAKEINGRMYKTKNFVKEIVLYGLLTIACIVFGVWLGVAVFGILTVVNIFLQIKHGGNVEDSIFKQGYYQYKQHKKNVKISELKRKKELADTLERLEQEFDDSDIDEELAKLEEQEQEYEFEYEDERAE